jgi:hypothetical protein
MQLRCVCPIESKELKELEPSDTFWFNTSPHMKIKVLNGADNVVNLQTGETLFLTENTIVLLDNSLKLVNDK